MAILSTSSYLFHQIHASLPCTFHTLHRASKYLGTCQHFFRYPNQHASRCTLSIKSLLPLRKRLSNRASFTLSSQIGLSHAFDRSCYRVALRVPITRRTVDWRMNGHAYYSVHFLQNSSFSESRPDPFRCVAPNFGNSGSHLSSHDSNSYRDGQNPYFEDDRPNKEHGVDSATYLIDKSYTDLFRSLCVLFLCRIPLLVKNATSLINFSTNTFGRPFTHFLLKELFVNHFCGGESLDEVKKTVQNLKHKGIHCILDYAVENDLDISNDFSQNELDTMLDNNMNNVLLAIQALSDSSVGYVAAKISSLIHPGSLKSASFAILRARSLFSDLSGISVTPNPNLEKLQSVKVSIEQFRLWLTAREIVDVDYEILQYLSFCSADQFLHNDSSNSIFITYFKWMDYVCPGCVGISLLKQLAPSVSFLESDEYQWRQLQRRLDTIANATSNSNISLLVDAEQSYFQPAIDQLVLNTSRRVNTHRAVIYNTYQMYLQDASARVALDLEFAKLHNFFPGFKIVRGAYMNLERKIAMEGGLQSPLHPNIEMTHLSFNQCVEKLLQKVGEVEIFLGTHNEASVQFALEIMQKLDISPRHDSVNFGHLLGMADVLTLSLADKRFRVYKYVPYGPISEMLPYLLRRADENSDVLTASSTDFYIILKALMLRLKRDVQQKILR